MNTSLAVPCLSDFVFVLLEHLYVEPSHALFEGTGVDPPNRHVAASLRRAKRLEAQTNARDAEQRASVREVRA
jgi:hypothetical protein